MVQYSPAPPLENLNPIQRYMQKGQLERQDWLRLIALVVAYFLLRPYIQKAAKWWFGDDQITKGEQAQKEYEQRRVAARVGANEIRSGKKDNDTLVKEVENSQGVVTSGSKVEGGSTVVNRKNKAQGASNKSLEDQLLDWDDEPARAPIEGDKADVTQWLDKWDS